MKKCVYAVCALLWAGCTASRSASDGSKDREQKETVQIDSLAPNPFIRHIYTADPSAHVWADGRLYVYASHDIDPPRGCDLMDQYHVFSTDDMVHWTDHGEILRASARYLRRGGRLLYSTCTLTRAENEDNYLGFLAENPAFAPLDFTVGTVASRGGYVTLLPDGRRDGFFIGMLQKTGD